MNLWCDLSHPRTKSILTAATYAGLDLIPHDYNPLYATEAQTKHYLKLNPTGSVPTLETPDGPLYETNAILRYIAKKSTGNKLYGESVFEEAQISQWLDWTLTELEPHAVAYSLPYLGLLPYNEEIHKRAEKNLEDMIKILEGVLKGKERIIGNKVTIGDIRIASVLNFYFEFLWDEKYREKIPNLTRWYIGIINEEEWKKVYGKPVLCKKALAVYKP